MNRFLSRAFFTLVFFCFFEFTLADVRKVPLAKTPAEVRNTITRIAGAAKINHINQRTEADGTTFEVSITRGGAEREYVVSEYGELLSMEVGLEELPALARATIQRVMGTNHLERIDRMTNDAVQFEVSFEMAKQSREFTVGADGVMTRYELNYLELPRIIRATVEKNIATNQIERVDRTFENGELNYDVQFTSNGYPRVLTIGTNAVLSRIEVGLNDTPATVRKTILAQLRGWKLGDIDKVIEEGEVTYEVDAKKGRGIREFTVGANGKLLSETVDLADIPEPARKTIQSKVGAGKITRIERSYEEDGTISFDVESKNGGTSFDFSVGADGTFLGEN
jgi:uncharacterized membrane protein YkoI